MYLCECWKNLFFKKLKFYPFWRGCAPLIAGDLNLALREYSTILQCILKKMFPPENFSAVDPCIGRNPKWLLSAWYGQTNFFSMEDNSKILFSFIDFTYPRNSEPFFFALKGYKNLLLEKRIFELSSIGKKLVWPWTKC